MQVIVTSGVPQGSIPGPTLWNDEVFRLNLEETTKVIGFTNDRALVATGKTKFMLT